MLEESLQQLGKRRVSWWTTTFVHSFRNSSILFICARNLVISDFLGKIFNQEVRNTLKRNTPYKLKLSRMTIDEVSSQDEHNSAVSTHCLEIHLYPKLHPKQHGQRGKGGHSAPLLLLDETTPAVLHPTLRSPAEERHGPVGIGPEETTTLIIGLENFCYEDRMWELELFRDFSVQGDFIAPSST